MRWLFWLLIFPGLLGAEPQTYRCSVCDQVFQQVYAIKSLANGEKKLFCEKCKARTPCCICGLPTHERNQRSAPDGRLFCEEDFRAGIFDERDAAEIFFDVRREMDRTFWRFLKFPGTNVTIRLVDAERLRKMSEGNHRNLSGSIRGMTLTQFVLIEPKVKNAVGDLQILKAPPKTEKHHEIFVVSGLPKARLMSICAHELGHVWMNHNLRDGRQIDIDTKEGFCELLAYILMDALSQPFEKAIIEANTYTTGQQFNMIEAEKQFGLYRIVEWMQNGVDQKISAENLDRIRVVETKTSPGAGPEVSLPPAPIAAPEHLMLKGISGSGKRRMVLINNQSLQQDERAKVAVGKTNVTVQCLEIRERSVLIQVQETGEKQELFLPEPTANKR